MIRSLLILVCLSLLGACGAKANYIQGTKVPRTENNVAVINRLEQYRAAVEKKDAGAILLMTSQNYWEDGGTPGGDDDYGYDGLQEVLAATLSQAESIRYSMRYERVRYSGDLESENLQVFVDVLVDASYTIPDARGGLRRADKRDHNQLVLEWDGEKWMFLAGM